MDDLRAELAIAQAGMGDSATREKLLAALLEIFRALGFESAARQLETTWDELVPETDPELDFA